MTRKYRLINFFDVWGNAVDGWEINNQCIEGEDFHIDENAAKKEICEYLKNARYLKTSDMRKLYVDNSSCASVIEIYERKGMMPLFAFEEVKENGDTCEKHIKGN